MALAQITTMSLGFPQRLSEKIRPTRLDEFVGLSRAKAIIKTFLANPKADAWYFVGASGTGKTSMALAMIDALDAEEHHIPSRSCDLETIRGIVAKCQRIPYHFFGPKAGKSSKWHVIHISEADQMTGGAQIDLLSKMDATEWPPNTIFILTGNGTQLLEKRLLSRCKVIEFDKPNGELADFLRKVYRREGGTFPLDFAKIANESEHNVRDALGKLEMEIMIRPSDRKGLPTQPEKSKCDHTHKCGDCDITYPCDDTDCRRGAIQRQCPFGGRPPCAGATREGAERNIRAWETRKSNGKRNEKLLRKR